MKAPQLKHHITLSIAALFSWGICSHAQDFAPDLSDQWNQQFLLRNAAPQPTPPTTNYVTFMEQVQLSKNPWQWSLNNFLAQYGFGYTHSYLNGSDTKKNGGNLSWLINAPYKFQLSVGLGVSGSSIESLAGSDTAQSLSISPSIQLGRDWSRPVFSGKLSYFGKTGYTATDNNSLVGVTPAFSQMSGWSYGGGINYSHNFMGTNNQIALSPSYIYNENETVNVPLGTTTMTHQGNVAVKLLVSHQFSDHWGASASATWLRNINFTTAPGQRETLQDWAKFGGDVVYSWNKFALDLGYSYDAFNSASFTHTATLQLKYKF